MTDYSRPVDFYCPACGHNAGQWGCYEHHINKQVPVYAALPVPESTTWGETGGDDALCIIYSEGGREQLAVAVMGYEAHHRHAAKKFAYPFGNPALGNRGVMALDRGPHITLVTAIRHVAEES